MERSTSGDFIKDELDMSQWTERIKTHPIWTELNLLGPVIDQAAAREGNDITVIDGLERLLAVLGFCGKRLASADTFLVEPRPLTTLNTALSNARTEIEAFITDGIAAHIANANVKADELLAVLPAILAPNSSDELTVISESISSYSPVGWARLCAHADCCGLITAWAR